MKLTPDFKARQCQLRTVCRRFSPKKRNKTGQKNQKGRSLKRSVLKPKANLWFLIISYNDILLFIQPTLAYFFYFFSLYFLEHKWNRRKFIEEKNLFQSFNSLQHIFKYMIFAKNENFMKFHILFVKYSTVYTLRAWVIKEREINREAMITFTMYSERVLAWKNCAVFKVYR